MIKAWGCLQPLRHGAKRRATSPYTGEARTARTCGGVRCALAVYRHLRSEPACPPVSCAGNARVGRGTQKCLRKRIRRHFLISQVKLQPRGCPLHGTVRGLPAGFLSVFAPEFYRADARVGARAGRLGRGDVHLHAAHLQIRLGPAQRRLGAGQVKSGAGSAVRASTVTVLAATFTVPGLTAQ